MSKAEAAARRAAQEAATAPQRGPVRGQRVWYALNPCTGSLVRLAGPDVAGAAKRAGWETAWRRVL